MTDVMLFAAGLGTRMRPLTDTLPKPLIPVGQTTLLDHALGLTQLPTINNRVVNIHYRADQVRAHLKGKSVTLSDESDELLDTGGGLKNALPLLQGDPIMGLNTDAIWVGPNPIPQLLSAWKPNMTCLLMVVPIERTVGHPGKGDFDVNESGNLSRGRNTVYTGLQLTRRDVVASVPDRVYSMNRVWDMAAKVGGLYGVAYPGTWCDVGHPGGIALAEAMLEGRA